MKIIFLAFFFLCHLTILASDSKFPLYKIGVKIDKPKNYFLLTTDEVKELKKEILSITDVCEYSKVSLDRVIENPNYQILLNDDNYNETIAFIKHSNMPVNKEFSKSLNEELTSQCYSFKNISIEYVSESEGKSLIGNYISFLYKVTTPEVTYYSEGFFIEGRNSTTQISINTINRTNNKPFIMGLGYINSKYYDSKIDSSDIFFYKDDYSNALNKVNEAIEYEPLNLMGYEKRTKINFILKKYNEVLKDADIILNIDENYLNAFLIKGITSFYINKYNDAINYFKQALSRSNILRISNSQNEYYASVGYMYRIMGETYIKLGNADKAIENYQKSLDFAFDSLNIGTIYYDIGVVKSDLEKNSIEAIKYYTLSIQNYPLSSIKQKSESYYNRGLNYRKIDKPNEAIKDYTSAIKLRPDYIKAYNNRAVAKISIEDYKGAIEDCSQAIKLDNGKSEFTSMAYFNRGYSKLLLDDYKGCDDIKKAKFLGQNISQNILNICK